jgi:hypothetical protein
MKLKIIFLLITMSLVIISCNVVEPESSTEYNDYASTQLSLTKAESIALQVSKKNDYNISQSEAIKKIIDFSKTSKLNNDTLINIISCSLYKTEEFAYYECIFKTKLVQGYSIVSNDERIPEILCYVERGSLLDTLYNQGLKLFFRQMRSYIKQETSKKYDIQELCSSAALKNSLRYPKTKNIPPFDPNVWSYSHTVYDLDVVVDYSRYVPVNWDQGSPFNLLLGGDAGCSTVATAQVMAYHMKDFSPNIFSSDWLSMIQNENHNKIPVLFRDIQNVLGSSASASEICSFLNNNGYSAGAVASYAFDDLTDAIYYGPTVITGKKDLFIGHSWVADAIYKSIYSSYDVYTLEYNGEVLEHYVLYNTLLSEKVHYNWGYWGISNGWFASGVFDPDEALSYDGWYGSGEPSYDYSVKFISYIL